MIKNLKEKLDQEIKKRNKKEELSFDNPDPLMIAKEQNNDFAILTCALFGYGNAKQIVKFLQKLPLNLLNKEIDENILREELNGLKYRFQTNEDIVQWFLLSQKIKGKDLKEIFIKSYKQNNNIVESIRNTIDVIKEKLEYSSNGIDFLIGKSNSKSPFKRWNMFLRWMVRKDNLDLGLWQEIDKKDLIIPLDTHTFSLGKEFGLIKRKSYDLKAAIELTESLKEFDEQDPVKYDFAIYRLGQERS